MSKDAVMAKSVTVKWADTPAQITKGHALSPMS
jgi:hypothetical protein